MKAFIVLSLLLFTGSARAYDYPSLSGIESTFTAVLLDHNIKGQRKRFKFRAFKEFTPERRWEYSFIQHIHKNKKAPLVFLIPGLGSRDKGSMSRFLAHQLYSRGFHVVVVPSTFHKDFVRVFSRGVYVGQPAIDAMDQYNLLKALKRFFINKGVQVSDWNLLGYSYGAATGSFVSYYDRSAVKKQNADTLNLNKVVLINPPLDTVHGLSMIDSFGAKKVKNKVGKALKVYDAVYKFKESKQSLANSDEFIRELNFSQATLSHLVSKSLSLPLIGVILNTQKFASVGVFNNTTLQEQQSMALQYNFQDYMNLFVKEFLTNHPSGQAFWTKYYGTSSYSDAVLKKKNNLYRLRRHFKSNKNIHIIHNADDFLLKPGDTRFLKKALGSRFKLFPRGGHLGNLWHEDVIRAYTKPFLD